MGLIAQVCLNVNCAIFPVGSVYFFWEGCH